MDWLVGAGFDTRSKAAVNRRACDCQKVISGWGTANMPTIQKERCEHFLWRKLVQERYRELELYLESNYVHSEADDLDTIATGTQNTTAYVPIDPIGPAFHKVLTDFIDRSNMTDPEVYKRGQIGRDTFSKIRAGKKGVSKKTVKQLCFGLKLSYDDAVTLMAAAGYAFSNNDISDLVVTYFLKHKIHDTYEVNAELYERNQELLFSGKIAYSR